MHEESGPSDGEDGCVKYLNARVRSCLAGAVLLLVPAAARAQIDYRNLDDDRPTLIEDAYPVERYGFEFLAPWRYARSRGANVHSFVPELEYGLLRNLQLGLKLPLATVQTPTGRDWGISGLRVFALYNFNPEGRWLPAWSLRTDATFPVGSLAGDATHLTLKGIATRSWVSSRLHLNGAYTVGPDARLAVAEAAHKWWVGAAVDRTLFRTSTLLVAEIYGLRPATAQPVELNASVGLRYQLSTMVVFDVGLTRRLRSTGPDYEITLGISRAFALPGVMLARR